MENIIEFIEAWQKNPDNVYDDHIDLFLKQQTFDYEDCLLVMRKMRQELNNIGLDEIEIMIRIQCGESKNIQKWGTQFWKLVDGNVTPPEIYIGKKLPKHEEGLMNQKIDSLVQNEIVENYISFYPDEEKFYRCLNIQERK